MTASPPHVLAVVDDLFFRAKIEATGIAAGVSVTFARNAPADHDEMPALVLVDLSSADPLTAIRAMKARVPAPTVIAFGPHRDVELLASAREAGADRVLARSALVERLAEILASAR